MTEERIPWHKKAIKICKDKATQVVSDWAHGWPFHNYPKDKFFSRPIGTILVIDDGFVGVNLRAGMLGKVLREVSDSRSRETNDGGEPVRKYRDFPWAGIVEPGPRLMISFAGLGSRLAVVDTRVRTKEVEDENLITGSLVQLPHASATVNYRVIDAVKAMTSGANFEATALEQATARLRDYISTRPLEEIAGLNISDTDITLNEDGTHYKPQALTDIGVKIDSMYLAKRNIPDNLEVAFAQQTSLRQQAKGEFERARYDAAARVMQAKADRAVAKQHLKAGQKYAQSPESLEVLRTRAAEKIGSGYHFIPGIDKIAEAVKGWFGSGQPPKSP